MKRPALNVDRRLLIGGIGATLVVAALWFTMLWSPQGAGLQKAHDRAEAARLQQVSLRAQITRLKASQGQDDAQRARLAELSANVPETPDLPGLLTALHEAAVASGVTESGVVPSTIEASKPAKAGATATTAPAAAKGAGPAPSPMKVQLDVTGSYVQLLGFFDRLASMPRVVTVDSFNVSANPDGVLTAQINVRAFTTQLPAVAAPANGAGSASSGKDAKTTATTGKGTQESSQ